MFGPCCLQCLFLLAGEGSSNGNSSCYISQLDCSQTHTAGGGWNDHKIAFLDFSDINQSTIGGHILHPNGGSFFKRKRWRIFHHKLCWNENQLAIHSILSLV